MSLYSKCISCGQHIVGPYFLSFLTMCLLTGGVETVCVTVAVGDFSLTPHHLSFVPCVHFSSATFWINGTHVMIPPHLLCSLTSHHSGSFHPGGSFRACAQTPDQTQSMVAASPPDRHRTTQRHSACLFRPLHCYCHTSML